MTSGIYKFSFNNGHFYIGKSIHIEKRWEQHIAKMLSGKAAAAVQACYNQYGLPHFEVLFKCHEDHIDIVESLFIERLYRENSSSMLNTTIPKPYTEQLWTDFCNHDDLLRYSTHEHIQHIVKLESELEALKKTDAVVEIKDLEQEVLDLESYNTELYNELQSMKDVLARIKNNPFIRFLIHWFVHVPKKYS